MFRKRQLYELDTISNEMYQYKGVWHMAVRIDSIDIEMRSEFEKKAILHVFRQILNTFHEHVQFIFRKTPIDFSGHILDVRGKLFTARQQKVREYGESYLEYLESVTKGKLDKVNYLIIRNDRKSSYEIARPILEGIRNQLERALQNINLKLDAIEGRELEKFLTPPDFVKECEDYFIWGNEFKRTYIIKDYPRTAFPNWLKPLLNFPYTMEIAQHLHPFPKDKIIQSLELVITKLESTINAQVESGYPINTELKVKMDDAETLLKRLASGEDAIFDVGFYVTLSADSLEVLNNRSYELESVLRQLQLKFRKSYKDTNKAILSTMPICSDKLLETYTFDTHSLSTVLPLTSQHYTNSNGVLYGIAGAELISFDRFSLPNPNMVVLGKSGFGKSMFAKIETARHIISGSQAIIIDHNGEWKELCELLGGQYVNEGDTAVWSSHMLVFGGDKTKALRKIWGYVQNSPLVERLLVIEEFHSILQSDKSLMLDVIKQIRKYFVAPTLITQNILDFLRSDEGQMIIDNCSIKVLLRQGENDLEEVERLFDLSPTEKMYLKTCGVGYGYLYTDLFKTKFKVDYSTKEEKALTTNPRDRMMNNG